MNNFYRDGICRIIITTVSITKILQYRFDYNYFRGTEYYLLFTTWRKRWTGECGIDSKTFVDNCLPLRTRWQLMVWLNNNKLIRGDLLTIFCLRNSLLKMILDEIEIKIYRDFFNEFNINIVDSRIKNK